jgi:type IV pilus assembly protein PilB
MNVTTTTGKGPVGVAGFPALLIDARLISLSDLSLAEQHARREQMPLADAVVALGFVREEDAYAKLAEAGGFEVVDLAHAASSELAVRLVPERIARRYFAVPLQVDNRTLTYATSQPFNAEAGPDIAFACGRRTQLVVAPRSAVLDALDRGYPKLRELDVLANRLRSERAVVENLDEGNAARPVSVVIDLCNHLIGRAIEVGASDVHIESGSTGTLVRYRICGVLEPVLTLPADVSQPIRNRFKVMAGADIAVRHKPQDGAFRLKVNGRPIDVRLSSLPTVDGEKLVMRVIDSQSSLQTLDRLGYDPETLTRFERALSRPDGLVLVTGPTGSGKTTALYAALGYLRTGRTNIVSVEDPVERTVPGVTQIPVNVRAGNTFPAVLKSLLRQDPNIIMVGEVRDAEVAQIVGQAAYTGHLVLTSMHTADTATAITRLTNLGLEPFKIAECLSAVLAQRLVRSLCPHCRTVHTEFEARRLGVGHHLARVPASAGPGCEHCKFTGYGGRVPVAELLTPSDELRDAIVRGATAHEIRAAMRAAAIPNMRDHALRLVADGTTSIEEVNRVLAADVDGAQATNRTRSRVLVTDDEPITRMLVKLLLERENFEVLEAANGRQAVDIATRERPDLLIIDLNMP